MSVIISENAPCSVSYSGSVNSGTGGGGGPSIPSSGNGLARSINFTGSNAVIIPSSASISFTTQASLFCWVKFTATDANLGIFAKSNYTQNKRCYGMETWTSSANLLGVWSSNGSTVKSIFNATTINDGAWHHVGWTFNANTVQLYVDSVLQAQQTLTANTINSLNVDASTSMTIGSLLNGATPTLNFTGKIFRPVACNVALSATQVSELFNLDNVAGTGNPTTLSFFGNVKALYSFDNRDSVALITDGSGNANNGALNGGAAGDFTTDVPTGIALPVYGLNNKDGGTNNDKWISVPHSASLNFSTAMSAFIFVNNAGTTDSEQAIFSKADYGAGKRSWFIERDFRGGNLPSFWLSDNGGAAKKQYISSISIGASGWHSVAFTWGASTLKVYVDGVLDTNPNKVADAAMSSLYQDATIPVQVGSIWTNGAQSINYQGYFDRPVLFNRALSDAEVLSVHNSFLAKTEFPASITGCVLEFYIQPGYAFTDLSGNGNDGTGNGYSTINYVPGIF